jgi:hypothetical protein
MPMESAITLVHDDLTSPRLAPADSVEVPAVNVVDDHLSISFTPPMLVMTFAEPLDPQQGRKLVRDCPDVWRSTRAGWRTSPEHTPHP